MADTDKYIGLEFAWGGRGPDSFDCFGLVRALLAEDGVEVKDFATPEDLKQIVASISLNLPLWEETELKPGAVLLFRVVNGLHVAYYEGDGRFIHTWQGSKSVVRERLSTWQHRLMGIYRYVG